MSASTVALYGYLSLCAAGAVAILGFIFAELAYRAYIARRERRELQARDYRVAQQRVGNLTLEVRQLRKRIRELEGRHDNVIEFPFKPVPAFLRLQAGPTHD